jgi:hypothetical protein
METKNENVKNTKEEYEIFKSKIMEGLEISYRKLLERKKTK